MHAAIPTVKVTDNRDCPGIKCFPVLKRCISNSVSNVKLSGIVTDVFDEALLAIAFIVSAYMILNIHKLSES